MLNDSFLKRCSWSRMKKLTLSIEILSTLSVIQQYIINRVYSEIFNIFIWWSHHREYLTQSLLSFDLLNIGKPFFSEIFPLLFVPSTFNNTTYTSSSPIPHFLMPHLRPHHRKHTVMMSMTRSFEHSRRLFANTALRTTSFPHILSSIYSTHLIPRYWSTRLSQSPPSESRLPTTIHDTLTRRQTKYPSYTYKSPQSGKSITASKWRNPCCRLIAARCSSFLRVQRFRVTHVPPMGNGHPPRRNSSPRRSRVFDPPSFVCTRTYR